jgi:uncharacterized membrane protein
MSVKRKRTRSPLLWIALASLVLIATNDILTYYGHGVIGGIIERYADAVFFVLVSLGVVSNPTQFRDFRDMLNKIIRR